MRQGIGRVSGGILLFNFGVVLSLRVFNADSTATVNLGTLMLAVSFTGLIVGSAVSERHRIGHELHEQTLYLHSLIENSPFGIVVLDPLRRVRLCDAAFEGLFLFSAREMSGKTLESLLSARDEIDQMRELSAQVFAGQPVHETVRHFRRGGQFLDIEINAVPLRREGVCRELTRSTTIFLRGQKQRSKLRNTPTPLSAGSKSCSTHHSDVTAE